MNILRSSGSFICMHLISFILIMLFWSILVMGVDDYTRADFPESFVFGAGTSAYQVEGAASEDGRTPSIWDTYAHADAGYLHGDNGDRACDQYHKYKEDVKLMVETGLEAYRFSISWSRLIPNGRGPVNPKGLEYYNNLINELVAHGIQPHVTLNHLDSPQALEDEYGGWLSRKIVRDFVAYANVCFKEFGDRVSYWTTLNEPNIFAIGGYDNGLTPPGRCSPPFCFPGRGCSQGNSTTEPYIAAHNMLLAHSSAVKLYRNKYKATQGGFVGINIYAPWFLPKTSATGDVIATQRAIDFYIGWLIHPLVFGDYPDSVKKNAGRRIPAIRPSSEKKLVKGSFDFIGLNHYMIFYVEDNPSSLETESRDVNADMALSIGLQGPDDGSMDDQTGLTGIGLYSLLEYIKQTYGNPPVYIQENGKSTKHNSTLNDISRVKFMNTYIGSVLDAIRNGSNTRGYIHWSFIDALELLGGFESSYGLIYVDFDDKQLLKRYPKLSAHCYSNFLQGRGRIWPCEITEVEDPPPTTIASL